MSIHEMDEFYEMHVIPKLTKKNIDNLKTPIVSLAAR